MICKNKKYNQGKANPNYKNGKTLLKYYCKNKKCNKEITLGSKLGFCKFCAAQERLKDPNKFNPNYRDGRYSKKYYCIDCEKINILKEIACQTWYEGGKRCASCAGKERLKNPKNNPMYGIKGSNHPAYKDGRCLKKYYCLCGKEIHWMTALYQGEKCIFCSHSLENNGRWLGGISKKYPLGWTKTFKEQIRLRDQYKCQLCGCHEVECKTKLHVHHIDYNKDNLDLNNLISLCNSCHSKTNSNRKFQKQFLGKLQNAKNY